MNIPVQLTLLRIITVPLVVLFYLLPFHWAHLVSAALFAAAMFTDWLDGFLARVLKQTTRLGAFLDPVADKILVSVALVLIVGFYANVWMTLPAAIILAREIIVSALREWMAELGSRAKVGVQWIGKVKTCLQSAAIIVLLYYDVGRPLWIYGLGLVLLYAAVVLTLWSMIIYLRIAWPDFKDKLDQ